MMFVPDGMSKRGGASVDTHMRFGARHRQSGLAMLAIRPGDASRNSYEFSAWPMVQEGPGKRCSPALFAA
jgi:hypothetical protein